MERESIPAPCNVLPSAEVAQQHRAARLPHQDKVIEPQFLEAAQQLGLYWLVLNQRSG